MNKPYELTAQEWGEVASVQDVQEGFGLDDEEEPATWLSENTYGVRFDYVNGSPGYVGPLYIVKGDGAPEIPPIMLIRTAAGLEAVEGW